jgi:hypothetical protein
MNKSKCISSKPGVFKAAYTLSAELCSNLPASNSNTVSTVLAASTGCHPKLSIQSYEKASPFGPSIGLQSSVFALDFTSGPGKEAGAMNSNSG